MELNMQVEREAATLRLRVEEKLRSAIAAGHFPPGARLIERELCAMLGVGRTSVREALRQLEAEGLIVSTPHRGPQVASVSPEEARQIYDVRALLEGFAGRGSALHATDEQIAKLKSTAKELEKAQGHEGGLLKAKTNFYDALFDSCGNEVVRQLLRTLHNRITLLRSTSMVQPGRLPKSLAEIRQIVDRIAARDPDGAAEACTTHVRNAGEIAVAVLAERTQSADAGLVQQAPSSPAVTRRRSLTAR
jgi:DNA-binding GntR family transcriptional regulator